MRKWINLVESALVPMQPDDYIGGTTIHDGQISIQGAHRDKMTAGEAKAYLDSNPDGTLHHDILETDAFVTKNTNGQYIFYDPINGRGVEAWDWTKDIADIDRYGAPDGYDVHNGWWYNPGEEMSFISGGMAFWDEIRNTPVLENLPNA